MIHMRHEDGFRAVVHIEHRFDGHWVGYDKQSHRYIIIYDVTLDIGDYVVVEKPDKTGKCKALARTDGF